MGAGIVASAYTTANQVPNVLYEVVVGGALAGTVIPLLCRDGLAGVFAFGAVIAAGTFQFSGGEVVIFGAAANIVAGLSTIAFGLLDDRIGPKKVITISLIALVIMGLGIFFWHDGGKSVFWVTELVITISGRRERRRR